MTQAGEGTTVSNDHKEPVGGGKKDRHPCPDGQHDWECDTASCPECWDPPCEPNREKEQSAYEKRRESDSPEQSMAAHKRHISNQRAAGQDTLGLEFEERVLDAVAVEVVHYSYLAHCRKCHVQAELDIVTKTAVIECKRSSKGFDLGQMKTRVIPIAKKCFPDKSVVCATRSSEVSKLEGKLRQWSGHLGQVLPAVGVG